MDTACNYSLQRLTQEVDGELSLSVSLSLSAGYGLVLEPQDGWTHTHVDVIQYNHSVTTILKGEFTQIQENFFIWPGR